MCSRGAAKVFHSPVELIATPWCQKEKKWWGNAHIPPWAAQPIHLPKPAASSSPFVAHMLSYLVHPPAAVSAWLCFSKSPWESLTFVGSHVNPGHPHPTTYCESTKYFRMTLGNICIYFWLTADVLSLLPPGQVPIYIDRCSLAKMGMSRLIYISLS